MEQRVKKARLFRTLKVVYYCLGLPVFLLAVFTLTMHNIGHNPFMGDYGEGMFTSIKSLLSAPAMYAIWIALAVWLIIGLVQLICKFAIKNRRTRAMVVVAIMLVVLLVPMFAIDAIYTSKIDAMIADAADGVVIKDYNYQLSYYRTHTSAAGNNGLSMKTSLTDTLKNTVEQYLKGDKYNFYSRVNFIMGIDSSWVDTLVKILPELKEDNEFMNYLKMVRKSQK